MNKTLWIIIILLVLSVFVLVFLNRGNAKIQEAIIVAVTGVLAVVLGVIFFSTENGSITREISTVYFFQLNGAVEKSMFSSIPSIKNTILDPSKNDSAWLEASPTEVRLKQNVILDESNVRKIAGGDFDKIWVVLQQSLDKKGPAFFTTPVLMHYLMSSRMVWGSFYNKNPLEAKKAFENIPNNFSALVDLQVSALIEHLSMFYKSEWDIERIKTSFPAFNSIGGRCLNPNSNDKEEFSQQRLLEIFSKNIFIKDVFNAGFVLPKGTQVTYFSYDKNSNSCRIRLQKRFAFDAEIKFYFSSYMAGLGKVGTYTGITKPTNKWNVNWVERDNFGTTVVGMSCKVDFSRLRSGDPAILRYRTWFNNLFDDLFNTFDWSVCDKEMREYNEELANQYIVSTFGNGLEQNKPNEGADAK